MFKGKISKGISLFTLVCFVLFQTSAYSLPQGAQVVSGQVAVNTSGSNMDISISTDKAITNWQSFSIAQPESVSFHQVSSSSVALNRVVGADPSSILGRLSANGKIFLVNPNGIVFGKTAVVDTAGLIASTLNISDQNFLAGRYIFKGKGGSVINQGYISSPGGYVALLGSSVKNSGIIEATLGSIALASGEAITLNLDPQGLIQVVIDKATSQNLEHKTSAVKNTGTISAEGGKVILTAKALDAVFDKAVNNEGVIEAKSLESKNGKIVLVANQRVVNSGKIKAQGGEIDIDSQGFTLAGGLMQADEIEVDAHGGDTYLWGAESGNVIHKDNDNIFVGCDNIHNSVANYTVWGKLELIADNNNDNIGDIVQWQGSKFEVYNGRIKLKGVNVKLRNLLQAGGLRAFLRIDADKDVIFNLPARGLGYNISSNKNVTINAGGGIYDLTGDFYVTNIIGKNINIEANTAIGQIDINSLLTDPLNSLFDPSTYYAGAITTLTLGASLNPTSGPKGKVTATVDNGNLFLIDVTSKGVKEDITVNDNNNALVGIAALGDLRINNLVVSAGKNSIVAVGSSSNILLPKNKNINIDAQQVSLLGLASFSGNINIRGNIAVSGGGNPLLPSHTNALLGIVTLDGNINFYNSANVSSEIIGLGAGVGGYIGLPGISAGRINCFGDPTIDAFGLGAIAKGDINLGSSNISISSFSAYTGNGDITLVNQGDLNVGEDIPQINNWLISNLGVDLTNFLPSNSQNYPILPVITENGDIDISTTGNMMVYIAEAQNGDISLEAGGSILDDLDDATAIRANNISLTAKGDIGASPFIPTILLQQGLIDSSYLDIALGGGSLSLNTNFAPAGEGNIYINEISAANINTSKVSSVNTPAGVQDILFVNSAGDITVDTPINADSDNIFLSAHNINVQADISSAGDIRLVLLGDLANLNNILVGADIISTNGLVFLSAGDNITQASGTTIQTNGGCISIVADNEADGSGGVTQVGTAQIISNGGDVYITAGTGFSTGREDIRLTLVNADSGDVFIIGSGLGSILDNDSTDDVDIIANNLEMWAYGNIGEQVNPLDTEVDNLLAYADSGDIYINETDSINLEDVEVNSSIIDITAGGDISAENVVNKGTDDTDDIILTSTGGGIDVKYIEASGLGDVELTAGDGDIFGEDIGGGPNVVADALILNAPQGSIYGENGSITNSAFQTEVNTLSAFADSLDGVILIYNSGTSPLTVTKLSAGDVAALASEGDLQVVDVDPEIAALLSYQGNIVGLDNAGNPNVTAEILIFYAPEGSVSNFITDIDSLYAFAGSHITNIYDIGSLTLEDVEAGIDTVIITSAEDMYVNYVYDPSYIRLTSENGAIIDDNDDVLNIETNPGGQLTLSAKTGIGSGNALETKVSNLQATNTTSGNIEIDNDGELTLADLDLLGYAVNNINWGEVNIFTQGPLNINAPVLANGKITLTAAGGDTGDINVNHNISGYWVDLYADNDINLNGDITADAIGCYIKLKADNDSSTEGAINWLSGNLITGGNLYLYAAEYIGTLSNPIHLDPAGTSTVIEEARTTNSGAGIYITSTEGLNVGTVEAGPVGDRGNVVFDAGTYIRDFNGVDTNITANDLTLSATTGIGSGDALETKVSNLQADNTTSGNIEIDNIGDLTIFGTGVKNNGSGIIDISTTSPIYVNSDVISHGGNIYLTAMGKNVSGNSIVIRDDINANTGNVTLDTDTSADSAGNILTEAGGKVIGNVLYIASDGSVNINTCVDAIGDKSGSENTHGSLTINEDDNVNLGSYNGLSTDDGDVDVTAQGTIWITDLVAGGSGDITLKGSNVGVNYAKAEGNEIKLTANNGGIFEYITDTDIDIISQDLILSAKTGIGSGDALETEVSNLQATNSTSGNIEIANDGDLLAQSVTNGGGDIYITTHSDLTLGYIEAIGNFVGLTAVNGSILNTSGSSLNILANTAELMALSNIGLAGSPINTKVDTLAAFSSGTGDIYISETDSIELGGIDTATGTAHSLAANNGIIHITSAGDMIVNSVVSSRGGVFLETTGGSIYAGTGWCCADVAGGLNPMAAAGTEWNTNAGIANFYQVVPLPLAAGPNVIAGGYSYFGAPNGTIGVGTPTNHTSGSFNPLWVNVQVLAGSHSALPAGFTSPTTPTAALNLLIGSSVGPTIDTGKSNGPLGVSGAIKGIVRPATTTNFYPSVGIDTINGGPSGYVFYYDYSDGTPCCSPLFGPAATLTSMPSGNPYTSTYQVWPPFPATEFASIIASLPRGFRAYYEILAPSQFLSYYPSAKTGLYAYHPLTPTDTSAFDDIRLDVGAYEFIENSLKLKDKNKFYQYYEDQEKKKKRKRKTAFYQQSLPSSPAPS